MPRRALGAARLFLLAAIAVLLTTCTDSTTSPPIGRGPSLAIRDGATGGNEDVFFLPPLVSSPKGADFGDRPANPDLDPFARVCTLNATETNRPANPACTDLPGAVADLPMTFDAGGGFYHVNWQTSASGLSDDQMYRIEIFIGSHSLQAFRDVDPDPGPPTGACKTTGPDADYCQFQNGSNLAIKVRIESFAGCLALDPFFDPDAPNATCATASLDAAGTLALQQGNQNFGLATVDNAATINMKLCSDLRGRALGLGLDEAQALGRVDLRTFGPCIEIDNLESFTVSGTATLCDAFDFAISQGLTEPEAMRMTVHRFSLGNVPPTDALPHAAGPSCDPAPAPARMGHIPDFNRMEKLVRFAERAWRDAAKELRSWIQPVALWANAATVCDRGGCGGAGDFESDYQVARPAWMDYFSPGGGAFGAHPASTVVTGKVRVFDSGEFNNGSTPAPAAVNDVRLVVKVTEGSGSVSPVTTCTDPVPPASICTGLDGIAEFTLTVGPGANTVEVSGIGVGTESQNDGNPVNNVFAPSFTGTTEVGLGVATLTFTATGIVPLEFVPDPPTPDRYLDATTGKATLDNFSVCTKTTPRIAGVAITTLVAVNNNGTFKSLGGLPTFPVVTGSDGCYLFSGVTIDGTGTFRLLANGQYMSRKFNIRPPRK